MSNPPPPPPDYNHPTRYTLRLQGHLDDGWGRSFTSLSLTHDVDGTTVLCGLVDQAALHGIFRKIRDSGLVILSVVRTDPHPLV